MSERLMSYDQLMSHAAATASNYLRGAIDAVDKAMGEGASEKYPEIVAAVITAAAHDYHAAMFSHRVAPALEELAEAVRTAGESSRTIGSAIEDAGHAIASAFPG